MKTWRNFLIEKTTYDFSSTHILLPKDLAKEIINWGNKIPEEDIYNKDDMGREDDIHVTILYGLHSDKPNQVREILEAEKPVRFKLGKTSIFEGDGYDVLKISVEGQDLHKLNKRLKKLSHTDTHPIYQPHVTIAYMKEGKGSKYSGNSKFVGKEIDANQVVFSPANGDKISITLHKPQI